MTDELKAFRGELATPSPLAAARARRRLGAAVAAERDARRPRRPAWRTNAALAAAVLTLAALVSATAGLLGHGDSTRATRAGSAAPDIDRFFAPRAGIPDGRLAFAPPEGKDAGTRPRFDTGGWSECGTDGCYLQL
jgi:hypothetical protein